MVDIEWLTQWMYQQYYRYFFDASGNAYAFVGCPQAVEEAFRNLQYMQVHKKKSQELFDLADIITIEKEKNYGNIN